MSSIRDKTRVDGRFGWALLCAATLLSGCSANRTDTAWQVIQQQKEEQMLVRQHEIESARKDAPSEPQLMLSLIRESQAQGRFFASLAYMDAYVQKFGGDPAIDAMRARALRLTGQDDQSEAAYRALLQGGRAAEAWHGLGLLAGARGDYPRAVQDLGRAAELAPTDADVLNDLGYARLRAGNAGGARIPLGMAAELAPANTRILSNLALLLLVEGNAAQAQRVMDQAALAPDVRNQIHRLADDIQGGRAMPAQALGDNTVADSGGYALPAMQPLMERFSNPRLIR